MSNTDQQLDQYQQNEQNYYHSPKIIEHNKRQHNCVDEYQSLDLG